MRLLYGERERDPKIAPGFNDHVQWPEGLKAKTRLFVYDKCEPEGAEPGDGTKVGMHPQSDIL